MKSAPIPDNEKERLAELYQYNILDTLAEDSYDQLTELASSVCNTPIALVSFIDEKRQWFKSNHGTKTSETPREVAFCAHTIHQNKVFEVRDSRQDPRFQDNPLVNGSEKIVFYAGAPLITSNGNKLGSLCVIDNKPSALTKQQKYQLEIIAKQVVAHLELRKSMQVQNELLTVSNRLASSLANKNKELEQFVYAVSHDLKSPLITISGFTNQLADELSQFTTEKQKHRFARIINNVKQLGELLTNLLQLSRVMNNEITKEQLDIYSLVKSSWQSLIGLSNNMDIELVLNTPFHDIYANETLVSQCLTNILSNAIRYRKPNVRLKIDIHTEESDSCISVFISDNGLGINKIDQAKIFQLFEQVKKNSGNGVGLSIVKTAMEKQQGQALLESRLGAGSCFELRFPKV